MAQHTDAWRYAVSDTQSSILVTAIPAILVGVVEIIRDVVVLAVIAFISRWSNNILIDGLWLISYGAMLGKYSCSALMFVLPRVSGSASRPNPTLTFASLAAVCATTAIALPLASNILVSPLTRAVVQVALLMR
jgi:hypothetical protein